MIRYARWEDGRCRGQSRRHCSCQRWQGRQEAAVYRRVLFNIEALQHPLCLRARSAVKALGSTVAALAFDPGATMGTGFLRSMPKPVRWLSNSTLTIWLMRRLGVMIGSKEFSGAGLARVAVDPAYANSFGAYVQSNDGQLITTRQAGCASSCCSTFARKRTFRLASWRHFAGRRRSRTCLGPTA